MNNTVYVGVVTVEGSNGIFTEVIGTSKDYSRVLTRVRTYMNNDGFDITGKLADRYLMAKDCFDIHISGANSNTYMYAIWASELEED